MDLDEEQPPIFVAETNFPRHVLTLLRPLSFLNKAHVNITPEGLRISVEDSKIMQAHAFMDVNLFRTYAFQPPPRDPAQNPTQNEDDEEEEEEEDADVCYFQISLTALLESLQIICSTLEPLPSKYNNYNSSTSEGRSYNAYNTASSFTGGVTPTLERGGPAAIFDAQTLRASEHRGAPPGTAICKFLWGGPDSADGFVMSMEDPVVTTTCTLTTYSTESFSDTEIDLTPSNLVLKVIMKSFWLHDALTELEASSPSKLIIHANTSTPFLVLEGTGGTTNNSKVEFLTKDANVLETFDALEGSSNAYPFSLIKHCLKALGVASMVSIRIDVEGVLSIQFMVLNAEGQGVKGKESSFLDFRFMPLDLRADDD